MFSIYVISREVSAYFGHRSKSAVGGGMQATWRDRWARAWLQLLHKYT